MLQMSQDLGFYWTLPQNNSLLIENFSWNKKIIQSYQKLGPNKLMQKLITSSDMIKLWAAKIKEGWVQ